MNNIITQIKHYASIVTLVILCACTKEFSADSSSPTGPDEFINYTIDGNTVSLETDSAVTFGAFYSNPPTYNPMSSQILGYRFGTQNRFVVFFKHPLTDTSGSFQIYNIHVQQYRSAHLQPSYPIIKMNRIPTVIGGYYEGEIFGIFTDSSFINHNISGNFRVKRRT